MDEYYPDYDDDYDDYDGYYYGIRDELENYRFNKLENNSNSLESLLSINQIDDSIDDNEQKKKKKFSLFDFHRRNLNNLKEDLIYYFSSPESLSNFRNSFDEGQINYDFYINLELENFMIAQKERFRRILEISNTDLAPQMKKRNSDNFDKNIFHEASVIKHEQNFQEKIMNSNLIGMKMNEYPYLFSNEEISEDKIFNYLNELKDLFINHVIDMESLGLVPFNSIETNLIFILILIENKLNSKSNTKNLTTLCEITLEIFKCFKSNKLFFYMVNLLKQYETILDFNILNQKKEEIQLIPYNFLNFIKIKKEFNEYSSLNLKEALIQLKIIEKDDNETQLNINNYKVIIYDNYILLFFSDKEIEKNMLFYCKFDVPNKNVVDIGKINLVKKEKEIFNIAILDINIVLENDFIYIFYLLDDSGTYLLKYMKGYKYSLDFNGENKIELKKSFKPKKLFIDNKYIFCISDSNEILLIERNSNFSNQKYINCSFRFFQNDMLEYEKLNDLSKYEMHNTFSINNIFILNNKISKKTLFAKFEIKKNEKYILNMYEMDKNSENKDSLMISFNDNIYIICKIKKDDNFIFDIIDNNFNKLVSKGIFLLPFNQNSYNNNNPDNLYEYLIQEYSSLINIFGNFELSNSKYLLKYPFSLCCNFDKSILLFIINNLIDDCINIDNNKLNYIIILKQMIFCLYNTEILEEEKIIKIIPYFKKLIINSINSKKTKLLNELLKEVIEIMQYIKDNTIFEIDEIKFVFDKEYNDINNESKFLLIDLLLKQNKIKVKELSEYIIHLEKNNLINYLQNNFLDNGHYRLFKTMINASESLFRGSKIFKDELISLIPLLSESVEELIKLYQKKRNEENSGIKNLSFIYNSFIFRSFYFIIEFLLANKIILRQKDFIISLYRLILLFDKSNINLNQFFYQDRIIEIINYCLTNEEEQLNIPLRYRNDMKAELKSKDCQDIIIQTNILSDNDNSLILKLIKIYFEINSKNEKLTSLRLKNDIIKKVSKINLSFDMNNALGKEKNFIINIIPIKNEKMFTLYKSDKDYKMISLIEKTMIHYLLMLYEDINSEIENYKNESLVKNYKKIFDSEIFKFTSISKNNKFKNSFDCSSEFNDKINKVFEKLKNTNDNIDELDILSKELQQNFDIINKEINPNQHKDFKNGLEDKNEYIYNNSIQNINRFKNLNCDKLFNIFNYELSNKNIISKKVSINENLNILINKIFLFGIKYYNCFDILYLLLKKVEVIKTDDIEDIKNNINKIKLFDNYSLMLSFYEESYKITGIYHKHKNRFSDSNFNSENKKFFELNNEKIDFLYDIIIPCDDFTIKPNTSIIKNLIELIDDKSIGIYEIIQNSRIQNISSQIKIIEFIIINNLLLHLNSEDNMILILNVINKKIHLSNNSLNSIYDNIYGADYFNLEKLKNQFHFFMNILSYKLLNNKNNYSVIAKLCLFNNLIWKIKRRDIPILSEVLDVFADLKNVFSNDIRKNTIIYYNITKYNEEKLINCQFEIFKILVYQLMNKIKEIVKFQEEKKSDNKLTLERTPSNISENDFQIILRKIMDYFIEINEESLFYDDMILFFYKILVNSDIIQRFMIKIYPNAINKIINIAFGNYNNINSNTKLIMIKLLCQIIKNINEDNLDDFSEIIQNYENINLITKNPIIFLYEKLLKLLNNSRYLENIVYKYYMELFFICANKICQLEKDDKDNQNLINNKDIYNLLLNDHNFSDISEDKFIIDYNKYNKLNNTVFLNKGYTNSLKFGKIICFLDDIFNNYFQYEILDENRTYETKDMPNLFYKSTLLFNSININYKYALTIMDDLENLDIYSTPNTKKIDISKKEIIKIESKNKKIFIESNANLIINFIKNELEQDNLNEKGLYLILKFLPKIIEYMKTDELIFFFKYICEFYNKNKSEENDYPFMSLEYLEKFSALFQLNNIKKIHISENDINKSLYSMFTCKIKDNILKINRNLEFIQKEYSINLQIPIDIKDSNIENIYGRKYKLYCFSFFLDEPDIGFYKIINENSVLITKSIINDNELSSVINIIEENKNKIKVILVNEINKNEINQKNLCDFISNNGIPIFKLESEEYLKFIEFFIKGNGVQYVHLYDKIEKYKKDDFTIFSIINLKMKKITEIQDTDTMEDSIKSLPENKLLKITNNPFYKSKLCKNYEYDKTCGYNDRCIFAHGFDELQQIQKIREYLFINQTKNIDKYETKRNKLFELLVNESKNLFNILNIKLAKRLIFDILFQKCLTLSKVERIYNNIENFLYIYDSLKLEYYFNVKNEISCILLQQNLGKYISKLTNENSQSSNKWIICNFDQIDKINYEKQIRLYDFLDNFTNVNNEKILKEKMYFCRNLFYEKFLVISEIISEKNEIEKFIQYYFNIIKIILNDLFNRIKSLDESQYETESILECLLLTVLINYLYKYYSNKITNKHNSNYISENIEFPNDFDEAVKKFMNSNLDNYLFGNSKMVLKIQTTSIIEFIFKYLDICLILFYEQNLIKFFDYMIDSSSLFKFYYNYKILTLDKNNLNNDYKEMSAFIYYINNYLDSNGEEQNMNKDKENILEMNFNQFNEFKFQQKTDFYDITFTKMKNNDDSFNKIAIFCFDEKTKKYYFQDIMDLQSSLIMDNKYKLRVNNNIYLVPLKNINTSLYSFENSNHKKKTKYENIPKYSWNIGYDGNKILLLSEENNEVYDFEDPENYSDTFYPKLTENLKIFSIKKKYNKKIVSFFNFTKIDSSFIKDEDGNIFFLDEKRNVYKWLNSKEKEKIEVPIDLPPEKNINIFANNIACYFLIKDELYLKGGLIFSFPLNCKKFLHCALGDGYDIYIIQNNEEKGILYANGVNYNYQCGIRYDGNFSNYMGENIEVPTKCSINENFDFKYVCTYNDFSAAITSCGKLYIWGKYEKILMSKPILINDYINESIFFDKIELNFDNFYAFGRILENGNYISKLFSIKITEHASSKNCKNLNFIVEAINMNKKKNNSKIIPVKMLIRKNRTYCLCIDENKLIEEIEKNNENKNSQKAKVALCYNTISKKEEHRPDNLQKIYNSEELNKFIDLFNSLSDKNLKNIINAFETLKKYEIKTSDIHYNEFISYLKDKKELEDLLSLFSNNGKGEGKFLFKYLKTRLSLVEKNMNRYISMNIPLNSEGFIQTIIKQNINYLKDDMRLQYFYSMLLNIKVGVQQYRQGRKIITIDRFKANAFKEKFNEDKIPDIHLNETVFGQLFHILNNFKGNEFFIEKGKNMFEVKLKNEDAIDQGGPYREILSDLCNDLQSDYVELFLKTPNNKNDIGELRDKYIVNPDCDNINHKQAYKFIGKLMILAISSCETFNFNFHPIIWKSLLEYNISFDEYKTIDLNFYNFINQLEEAFSKKDKDLIDSLDLNFAIKNSNGKDIELINNGQEIKVTLENVENYIKLAKTKRLEELNIQIESIKNGIFSVIVKNVLKFLDYKQLENMVCGEAKFDIEDFKNNTESNNEEEIIKWFWEWLESCKDEDKFKYLKFVSGRARLPKSGYTHKIVIIQTENNLQLPVAHTCFSQLDLPRYKTKEILCEKMKYAIENITNITDS